MLQGWNVFCENFLHVIRGSDIFYFNAKNYMSRLGLLHNSRQLTQKVGQQAYADNHASSLRTVRRTNL